MERATAGGVTVASAPSRTVSCDDIHIYKEMGAMAMCVAFSTLESWYSLFVLSIAFMCFFF